MKRAACATVLILLLSGGARKAVPGDRTSGDPSLTKAQWQEDVRYFGREMPKRHKNLFHVVTREEFDKSVADLEAAIPSLSGPQIIVRVAQITAKVGDGHTGIHIPRTFRRYPLAIFWFGDELRVTAATKEYERALGTRLIGIGGAGIDEVMKRVSTCFPSAENENSWYVMGTSPAFILLADVLQALGIVADADKAPFTFEDDQGQRFSLEVQSVVPDGTLNARMLRAAPSEPLTRQRRDEQFWFTWLPDTKTVYVSFRGYESLAGQAREMYKLVDANPTERLVIDMRQNGGGDFLKGRKHLIEPLKERPALNQKGKVFVAIGRNTFSAAMVNAIDFRKETNALLVGEPIGERPNSYSENDELTLPNSHLVVSYSTQYYRFLDDDPPAVMPDVRIDPLWEAFKAGNDPVMDWILAGGR